VSLRERCTGFNFMLMANKKVKGITFAVNQNTGRYTFILKTGEREEFTIVLNDKLLVEFLNNIQKMIDEKERLGFKQTG